MRRRHWATWIVGTLIVAALLAWLLKGFDFARFRTALLATRWSFDVVLLVVILLEQYLRAWKWRQVMWPTGRVPTSQLFGALLASYVPGLVVGMGPGLVVRAWLVARRSGLRTASVLATTVVDRLIDGLAFLVVVAVALTTMGLPAHADRLRVGLLLGAALSATFIALGIALVHWHKRRALRKSVLPGWLRRISPLLAQRLETVSRAFADGTAWPSQPARGAGIVVAALGIKALAISDMLWATLAVGVVLNPTDYVLIMVFLSAVTIAGFFIRLPGGMLLASVFVLRLFGMGQEPALIAGVMMEGVFLFVFVVFGAAALFVNGVRLSTLFRLPEAARGSAGEGNVHAPDVDDR